MDEIGHDVRYAVRRLRRSPGFTSTALAILAVGIGAVTAVFSITDAFLLRPLPFAEPGQLVHVWATDPRLGHELRISVPNYQDLRAGSAVLDDLGGYYYTSYTLETGGEPLKVTAALLTSNLLPLLGVAPELGRAFTPEEGQTGRDRVLVLSHGFWQRHLAGGEQALGATLTLDGVAHTVVGVMPREFVFPFSTVEMWRPLVLEPEDRASNGPLLVVGRLAPGRSRAEAQAELAGRMERLAAQYPADNTGKGVKVVPLRQALLFYYDMFRTTSFALLLAVAFVLLIICANLGNLLLARAAGRGREIGIRTALGAPRRRLLRQLMTESILLALTGGALGAGLAHLAVGPVGGLIPGELYRVGAIGVDAKALVFTFSVALGAALLFGLAPALQALSREVTSSLKAGGPGAGEAASPRLRNALVVAEVALAMFLLAGATLMVRTFVNLQRSDTGFNAAGLLTLETVLPTSTYPDDAEENRFYEEVLRRAGSLPGVERASLVYPLPLNFESIGTSFTVEGREAPRPGDEPSANLFRATSDYFRTLEIPLHEGRAFSGHDGPEAAPVAVVNRTFAQRYFAGEAALGRRLAVEDGPVVTVVGVVGDSRVFMMNEEPAPVLYLPQLQSSTRRRFLLLRTAGDPLALAGPVREEIRAVDPELPVTTVRTMEQVIRESLGPWVGGTAGLGLLGMGALLLAVMGIYGVVSYTVALRTREIGIRVALGARRRQILAMVVGQGMKLTAVGVLLGTLAALGLAQLLQVLLFGVDELDPLTLVGAPAFLAAVALLATYLPARRAARVEASEALRHE